MSEKGKMVLGEDPGLKLILEGMDVVARTVASTYGPNGRNVILEDVDGSPHITKDGVTVANSISFSDPARNIGASLLKDAAMKTLKEVGDGTTTTVILANLAAQMGMKVVKNLNPFKVRDYLDKYLQDVIKYLRSISTPVDPQDKETLKRVALNSANGDEEIAEKVTDLFSQIGKDGVVFVKDSNVLGIHTQVIKGISVDRGYVSPLFCVDGQSSVTLDDCKILISKRVIRDYKDIIPYLQQAADEDKPILLIVPEVDNTVTELFLTNIYQGTFRGCIIQAPYSHERQDDFFQDLGVASGAIVEDKDVNSPYLLGEAEKVIVGRYDTEFRGLKHNDTTYKRHLAFLEDLVQTQTDRFLAEKAGERLAMFSGSIGYINIGASSETEKLELQDKLDDVIHAVKAALKEGTVPAGGVALADVAHMLEFSYSMEGNHIPKTFERVEQKVAYELIVGLCKTPKSILGELRTTTKDPTKVVYTALQNALSVAGLLFTSNYVVLDEGIYYSSGKGQDKIQ